MKARNEYTIIRRKEMKYEKVNISEERKTMLFIHL